MLTTKDTKPLQYIAPLEYDIGDVVQNPDGDPVFMISSSGILVLHTLAMSEADIAAVDFDRKQFLLLNILASAVETLGFEDYIRFVSGESLEEESLEEESLCQIAEGVGRGFSFFNPEDVTSLVEEYHDIIREQNPDFMKWYRWLNPSIYKKLKEAIGAGKITPKFGEFRTVLQFEPDEYYGFIDMSNIREWKYEALRGDVRIPVEHHELYVSTFGEWDRKLAELCFRKARPNAILRNKIFPEFWDGALPGFENCEYWRDRFCLVDMKEGYVSLNGKPERVASSFYKKLG